MIGIRLGNIRTLGMGIVFSFSLAASTGCVSSNGSWFPFYLNEDTAAQQLMATEYVKSILRKGGAVTCGTELIQLNYVQLYLNEAHFDRSVPLGRFRVTSDGRVWMDDGPTPDDFHWVLIR
jgi:hypothetical protein